MEGRDEGNMDGKTQNSRAAGRFGAETHRAELVATAIETVADVGVACLGETRGTQTPA